jgi:accessory colonization factor AcfC
MTERVYGLPIEIGGQYNADILFNMSREEKLKLIEEHKDEVEVYTIESWYFYLNSDRIDTENFYWILV